MVCKRTESRRRAPAAPHGAPHANPIPREEMRVEKQCWIPALPRSPMVSAQGARELPKGTWGSGGSPSTHLSVERLLLFWYVQFRRQKEDTVEAGIQDALRFAFQCRLHSAGRTERSLLDTVPRGFGKEGHGPPQGGGSLPASFRAARSLPWGRASQTRAWAATSCRQWSA